MSKAGRYRQETPDLTTLITQLEQRLKILEANPRIGATAIDTGSLTVKGGEIIIEDDEGTPIIRMFRNVDNGQNPEIRFSPLGPASDHVNAVYSQYGTFEGVNQLLARFDVVTEPGFELDGGSLQLFQTGGRLAFKDDASGLESCFEAGIIGGVAGRVRIKGRWAEEFQIETTDAVYAGTTNFGAGFGGVTYAYFSTWASTMVPIIGLLNSGGVVSWNLSAFSTASFTLVWSGTAAKTINMWCVRV